MGNSRLPTPTGVVALSALALCAASLVFCLAAEGQAPRAKEKHGGNILFLVEKPTKEIKEHVLFSHELHIAKGADCQDCHDGKLFLEEKKLGVNHFTMKDILRGKACGGCHEAGGTAFAPTRNCSRCHNVKVRKPAQP